MPIYILDSGYRPIDLFTKSVEVPEKLTSSCALFLELYSLYDSKSFSSKKNREFVYKALESSDRGNVIVIISPSADYIDKRLRERATILRVEPDPFVTLVRTKSIPQNTSEVST